MRADISREHIIFFLKKYAETMGVAPEKYVNWLPEKYPAYQLHAAKRAARNSIKRNHAVQHFKCCGYRVVMIKGEDEVGVRKSIHSFVRGGEDTECFGKIGMKFPFRQKKHSL